MQTKMEKGGAEAAPVSLRILGRFELTVFGQSVPALNERPSRLRSLLCYLILHRSRAVTHAELIETFYGDEDQRDPEGALKMQILRLRNLLRPLLCDGSTPILSHRGSYQWAPSLPCEVDAEQFESLCAAADDPARCADERLALFESLLPLYRGALTLERNDSIWSRTRSAHYFSLYLTAVQQCAELLLSAGRHADAEALCTDAIASDPMNETLYVPALRAMIGQKKYAEARRAYIYLSELLHRELGVRPSEALQQLYAQCMREDAPAQQDLDTVMETLYAYEEHFGALYCGIEQFRSIYQLELRRIRRSGECLHIVMLTVTGADGAALPTGAASGLMESVRRSVVGSLRQSDVVAQYSATQFIILLPCANYENSVMVSRRIVNAYRVNNPRSAARISCQVREPELV